MDEKDLVVKADDAIITAAGGDDIISIAAQAEARVAAVVKIKQTALMATSPQDWVDQQDRPYLQASGSEKIANLFGISWRFLTAEPKKTVDADGHYTYTFVGEFRMGSRTIEVEGSRSSRDGFFKQYKYTGEGQNKKKEEIPLRDRSNERDVAMAALTNLLGNGITRILGIRNLTWEDLAKFASINKNQLGRVEYKTSKKVPTPQGDQKAAPQQPRETTDTARDESGVAVKTVRTFIQGVATKDGITGTRKWTRYIVTDVDGERYNTLDAALGIKANDLKGVEVNITFAPTKYGNELKAIGGITMQQTEGEVDQGEIPFE